MTEGSGPSGSKHYQNSLFRRRDSFEHSFQSMSVRIGHCIFSIWRFVLFVNVLYWSKNNLKIFKYIVRVTDLCYSAELETTYT
jgi:hypothetical protein